MIFFFFFFLLWRGNVSSSSLRALFVAFVIVPVCFVCLRYTLPTMTDGLGAFLTRLTPDKFFSPQGKQALFILQAKKTNKQTSKQQQQQSEYFHLTEKDKNASLCYIHDIFLTKDNYIF